MESLCRAGSDGDLELLASLLDREDPIHAFQGDINEHYRGYNALHYAAVNGQLECIEVLLKSGADPHIKTCMPHGKNPADGRTAAELADDWGWDDVTDLLKASESNMEKGIYLAGGPFNNAKIYPSSLTATGRDPDAVRQANKKLSGMMRPFFCEQHETRSAVGLLFPGQGSQYVQMLSDVKDLPGVVAMLHSARQILNWDPLEVCLNGPASQLDSEEFGQPALFIAGAAALERLRRQCPKEAARPAAVAGMGVGEFTALLAAGVLPFEDVLRLVKIRGEAMRDAAANPPQALLSVAGVRRSKLEGFCKTIQEEAGQGAVCTVAMELFPKGATCGGTRPCIEKLQKMVKENGALQARLVQIGASHTPLMAPAVPALRAALEEVAPRLRPPTCDMYLSCTGRVVLAGSSPKALMPLLLRQLTEPVRWESCVKGMIAAGIHEFREVGPMKQLKAMMKRIDAGAYERTTNVEV